MSSKRLYLIDATALCYRAFYALGDLSTSFGQPTNAVYGFINMLNKILKEKKPDYLAVCFDVSRDTFRQRKFAEYKINRPPMPDGLSSQIPLIKQVISAYGIRIFEKEGFEADDVIATMTRMAGENKMPVTIVSSDKDMLQLVDSNTQVLSPYKDEGVLYDDKKVFERFGVTPGQIADIISLMGDSADNIPNVPGIGEGFAVDLIKTFGSLDKLLDNPDKIKQEKIRDSIKDNIGTIRLNRELVNLDKNVDIDFDLEELKAKEPDYGELFKIFKYLEFKKLLKDLPAEEKHEEALKIMTIEDSELNDSLGVIDELFLYGQNIDDLIFCASGKFFRINCAGKNLRGILQSPAVKKISHDLKKIKILLAKNGIALGGIFFDTLIAAYLVNPSKSEYSLVDLAWDYLGERFGDNAVDREKAISLLGRLVPRLENELRDRSLFKLFSELEIPLVEVLADMELDGIKLDLGVLNSLSRDIEKRLIKLIADIYETSGTQFNINSPKQLSQVLFEKLKLPVIRRSKTGPSTDEEVLKKLAPRHKLPALLLEYRQLTKLKNTYIDTLPDLIDKKTGRIHTSFNQTATETGRLSSSNPNLQNIPIKTEIGSKIRQAIIAFSEDSFLLSYDYSQIELRILAHISKDENLVSAFREGRDTHKATAALIYGLAENDITDQMREVAKRVNFGIVYGLTAYGLSRDLGISVEEAQSFIEAYFTRYPKVEEYIHSQIKKAREIGFVTTILGRRRYIPDINNKNQGIRQFAERQAVNTPIQGSASDLIKLAMVDIQGQIRVKDLKSKMILQIHDELVFNVPEEELGSFAGLVKDRMENVLELDVPIRVSVKKGKNWLEMEEME